MKTIISTPKAPAAIGPYSQAVLVNGMLFTSGVIPIDPETNTLVEGDVTVQARQAIGNLKNLIEASGSSMDKVVKTTVFIKDMNDFGKINADIMGSNTDPFYGAPVILIVLGKKDWPTHVYDGSLVMGNLMLAAHDLGIGSCWIHRAKEEFESDWGKKLLKSLGIEDEYEGIGHCALGYVDGDYPDVIPRKENRVFYI